MLWINGRRRVLGNFIQCWLFLAQIKYTKLLKQQKLFFLAITKLARMFSSIFCCRTTMKIHSICGIRSLAPRLIFLQSEISIALKCWVYDRLSSIAHQLFPVVKHCLFETFFGVLTSFYDWILIHFSKINIWFKKTIWNERKPKANTDSARWSNLWRPYPNYQ